MGQNCASSLKLRAVIYSPWSPDGSMIAYSIHTPRNECVIVQPDKAWSDQKLIYISPLSDASWSFEGWRGLHMEKVGWDKTYADGVHSGIEIDNLESKTYDWLTDFGDWPI